MNRIKYWTTEYYGRGTQYRRLGFYPKCIPLYFYSQHGVYYHKNIEEHELLNGAPIICYFDTQLKTEFLKQRVKGKSPYPLIVPDPFVIAQRECKSSCERKGTLFFWAHSTDLIHTKIDFEGVLNDLMQLPERFHPIDICIHYHDKLKDIEKNFGTWRYNVYCVGKPDDYNFAQKFYLLLGNYKFTSSNILGSYTCYSVRAEIPFFLYSHRPNYTKISESSGVENNIVSEKSEVYLLGESLFDYKTFDSRISKEQIKYVENRIGKITIKSRIFYTFIAYFSLLYCWINHRIKTFVVV
jgi:hypothetical protein